MYSNEGPRSYDSFTDDFFDPNSPLDTKCSGCMFALKAVAELSTIHIEDVHMLEARIDTLCTANGALMEQNSKLVAQQKLQESEISTLKQKNYQDTYKNVCADFIGKIYNQIWRTLLRSGSSLTDCGPISFFDSLSWEDLDGPRTQLLDNCLSSLGIEKADYELLVRFKDSRNTAQHSSLSISGLVEYLNEKSVPPTGGFNIVRNTLLRLKDLAIERK